MTRIRRLRDEIKKQIAAGEVIEGPHSIVKELVENALDAGATEIQITLAESGMKKISVRDNGAGIVREDLPLTVEEHATSKIQETDDILHVASYGFRGEALSSISSVADITILSRNREDETGGRLSVIDGKSELTDYAGARGTMVIVERLFYAVPARKKFLKSARAESRQIREQVLRFALARPDVRFILENDGKTVVRLEPSPDPDERFARVYGQEARDGCIRVSLQDFKVSLWGYLSRPYYLKGSRNMQLFFINGRPVEYPYLGYILSRGYEAVAMRGTYPVAVLFLEIEPDLVDVNIHPAKREVKLFDKKYVDSLILSLTGKALDRAHSLEPAMMSEREPADGETCPPGSDSIYNNKRDSEGYLPLGEARSGNFYEQDEDRVKKNYSIIGQALSSYLVVEKDESLYLIDFHAAHERFLFDRLLSRDEPVESQELAFPETLELGVDDFQLVMENRDLLSEMGCEIDEFSGDAVVIRSVPSLRGVEEGTSLVRSFLDEVRGENGQGESLRERAAASIACHSSRRSGDRLDRKEMETLASLVLEGKQELRCPHGRPYLLTLKREEIEKMVRRK